jgi:hypothetical protein
VNSYPYRIYLKGELAKLGNSGDAESFLKTIPEQSVSGYGMPTVVEQLVARFSSQQKVTSFVDAIADADLVSLNKACSQWRDNCVFDKLQRHFVWREDTVPIERIDVKQAEERLGWLFKQNGFQLTRIAHDPELRKHFPYSAWKADDPVHFPMALGGLRSDRVRLFDGIHRAIKLVQMGKDSIRVCYYVD